MTTGCCLCEKEMNAGRGGWGFKSHCIRSHAYMCNFSDLQRHNPTFEVFQLGNKNKQGCGNPII